jgi:hypothetical protein
VAPQHIRPSRSNAPGDARDTGRSMRKPPPAAQDRGRRERPRQQLPFAPAAAPPVRRSGVAQRVGLVDAITSSTAGSRSNGSSGPSPKTARPLGPDPPLDIAGAIDHPTRSAAARTARRRARRGPRRFHSTPARWSRSSSVEWVLAVDAVVSASAHERGDQTSRIMSSTSTMITSKPMRPYPVPAMARTVDDNMSKVLSLGRRGGSRR